MKDDSIQMQFSYVDYDWNNRMLVGQGGFGKVFKVKNIKTGEYVAIKQMPMQKFNEQFKMKALVNQISLQKQLSNPFTLQYINHNIGSKYTYIITQLCDKDLKSYLVENNDRLPQKQCSKIYNEISKGFENMVNKGYIHRDVKPQNILIKGNSFKVADFGFSRKLDIEGEQKIKQACGTPLYMAPQLLLNQQYSAKCDIWSLGIMLYEMIFGFGPWPSRHPQLYKHYILTKPLSFPYQAKICENTKDLITRCLKIKQSQRIGWKQFFQHPFITNQDLGKQVKTKVVQQQARNILKRIQQSTQRKNINVLSLFEKYSKQKSLKEEVFYLLLRQLDSQISSYESKIVFKTVDIDSNKEVDIQEFKSIFCDVDYRPSEDIISRRIQQIVGMAQARKIGVRQLFQMFDTNKSGTIQKLQFQALIQKIAPKISLNIIKQMWAKLDSDKSGQISIKQFLEEMTRGVQGQQSKIGINRQRAKRNLACLKQFLIKSGVTPTKMMAKVDSDNSKTITINQFGPMIMKINYVITKPQIQEMFSFLDKDNSGSIDINELNSFLK